ncbi:976_t:CDS:1, partial [Scutellospora calospora]
EKIEDYTTIQKAIEDTISAKLQELPKRPNLISEEIQNILTFELPIKKRSQTTAI